ncbi:MAG TPA: hypothetical protein VGJ09_01920, partial [Bryobacteraceae bacterium]
GPGGNLYVADPDANRVRVLTPAAASVAGAEALNAASLLPGPIAPGMLVAIQGAGASATEVLFAGFPAAILAADSTRILVQAPAQIAGVGTIQIEVRDQGILRAVIPATASAAAPALFTSGSGQAAAVNQNGNVNSSEHPVPRGSWISLYGTGEGMAGLPVSVSIGGYAAEVLYAGEVAGYPGLFQINVQVPAGYLAPGNLAVVWTVGSATNSVDSQAGVTLAVE